MEGSHHFHVMARRSCSRIALQSQGISLESDLFENVMCLTKRIFQSLSYCTSSIEKMIGIATFPPLLQSTGGFPSDLGSGIAD